MRRAQAAVGDERGRRQLQPVQDAHANAVARRALGAPAASLGSRLPRYLHVLYVFVPDGGKEADVRCGLVGEGGSSEAGWGDGTGVKLR
eukprot:6186350-Pleurochrysis_carterae.AAC.2